MKKYSLYALIALCAVTLILPSCSKSGANEAQEVAEHFWRLSYLNRLDSFEVLYPGINDLNMNKSEIVCSSFQITDVIELGNNQYEVRTMLDPGAEGGFIRSLFVKPNENGKYFIYDSRGLKGHKKAERKDLVRYGVVEDEGNVYVQKTDQERCHAINVVIPKIQELIADSVNNIIKKQVAVTSKVPEMGYVGCMKVTNKSPYDLSKIPLVWSVKCDKYYYGTALDEVHNEKVDWTFKSLKKSAEEYCIVQNRKIISIISSVELKNKADALKVWQFTGDEYSEWLDAHPEDKLNL